MRKLWTATSAPSGASKAADGPDLVPLTGLDREMGLSEPERVALAEASTCTGETASRT